MSHMIYPTTAFTQEGLYSYKEAAVSFTQTLNTIMVTQVKLNKMQ